MEKNAKEITKPQTAMCSIAMDPRVADGSPDRSPANAAISTVTRDAPEKLRLRTISEGSDLFIRTIETAKRIKPARSAVIIT